MRSVVPVDGDPWPHDMILSIDDRPQALLELLWVREAWGLEPEGDLPGPLADAPGTVGTSPDAAAWEEAWPGLWNSALAHAAQPHDPILMDRLQASPDRSGERADLLALLTGPTWRDRFGDTALEVGFTEWSQRDFEKRWPPRHNAAESPERLALDDLVPAWNAGLERVLTIPCVGEHTRVVSASSLLVTESTRWNPALYSSALRTFVGSTPGPSAEQGAIR